VQDSIAKPFSRALKLERWLDVTTQFHEQLEILQFDYDSPTGVVLVGCGTQRGASFLETVLPDLGPSRELEDMVSSRSLKRHLISPFQSEISSVNFCHASRTLVTTTTGSSTPPSIHICTLSASTEGHDVWSESPERHSSPVQTVGAATVFTSAQDTTVWSAALRPPTYNEEMTGVQGPPLTIAIGTSAGLFDLTYTPGGYFASNSLYFRNHDVRSMAWLSPNLLALGTRGGQVPFWDPRSRGHSVLLRHAASITSVHAADDPVRIVVSGFHNTMAMYDIRMIRPQEASGAPLKGNNRQSTVTETPISRPVLMFDHVNAYSYPLGIDVHQQLGLLAAADAEASVNIYSLNTGKKLTTFLSPDHFPALDPLDKPLIRCVRFITDDRDRPAILAASRGEILRIAW
jgi:WD40 repeat protein